jgi:hypothetical protein
MVQAGGAGGSVLHLGENLSAVGEKLFRRD